MVFISGEGGGAGSRLTQDVGNILAQLPETVESLTGGGRAGMRPCHFRYDLQLQILSCPVALCLCCVTQQQPVSSLLGVFLWLFFFHFSQCMLRACSFFLALYRNHFLCCVCWLQHLWPTPAPYLDSSRYHQRTGALLRGRGSERLREMQPQDRSGPGTSSPSRKKSLI